MTNLVAGATVPVLATAGVDSVIRANDAAKERQWRPMFKDEWPARRTFPSRIVRTRESVTFDGVTFTVHDLGPGESHHDSYWVMEGGQPAAFIGDVVLHGVHAYTADGHTAAWIANLDRLKAALGEMAAIYPGHGDPGGPELLDWQRRYLTTYRQAVGALARGQAVLSDSAKALLVARMGAFLPGSKLDFLIGLGGDPVAAELAAEAKRQN